MRDLTPFSVTLATPEDEDGLIDLLRERHCEEGFGNFDEKSSREKVSLGLSRKLSSIGVIRGASSIEASIGLYVEKSWDSDQDHIAVPWAYVIKKHRLSNRMSGLVEFAKWFSNELITDLVMVTTSNTVIDFKSSDVERIRLKVLDKRNNISCFVMKGIVNDVLSMNLTRKDHSCHRQIPKAGSVFVYIPPGKKPVADPASVT